MRPHHAVPLRAAIITVLGAALSACLIQIHMVPPKPPGPMQTATSLQVAFDYSGLSVAGMGGAKSEAEWVAAKTAEDPDYPKTWADLKAKWEDSFMGGLASGSPLPVSRAPIPQASASADVRAPVLLAQAETAAPSTGQAAAAPAGEATVASDANLAAPAAAPVQPAAAPVQPAAPFDGVLTVRVSLASLTMGKYIPMFTKNAEVRVVNTWWAGGQMVDDSSDTAVYVPSLSAPSVFQHIQALGKDTGGRAGTFLRKRHHR